MKVLGSSHRLYVKQIESDFSRIHGEDTTDSLVCKWEGFFDANFASLVEMLKKKGASKPLLQANEGGGMGFNYILIDMHHTHTRENCFTQGSYLAK